LTVNIVAIFLLVLVVPPLPVVFAELPASIDRTPIDRIILISWDGARKFWVDRLIENGTLANLAYLRSRGSEITLKIVSHITVTDPGLANIETGYGAAITGVDQNYFGSATKRVIPEGLTTFERLRQFHGNSWKNALVMPWTQGPIDNPSITRNQDSIFWNAKPAIDYWFSSENLTWIQPDANVQLSFGSALLRADYVAGKTGEFVRSNSDDRFYARVHMVEPDFIGHSYSESVNGLLTPEYMNALVISDKAVGKIIEAVQESGIEDSTVILVTTDHGFIGPGHSGPPYPEGDIEAATTFLLGNTRLISNELGWGIMDDIAPTVLAMSGIDVNTLSPSYAQTSHGKPLWQVTPNERETTSPEILSVTVAENETNAQYVHVTVVARDASGIRNVRFWYAFGPVDFRFISLLTTDQQTFTGSLGPFETELELKWYVQVIDGAVAPNLSFYPGEGNFNIITIGGGGESEEQVEPAAAFNEVFLGLAVVIIVSLLLIFYRARNSIRKSIRAKQ
jgi:hypothetical protein